MVDIDADAPSSFEYLAKGIDTEERRDLLQKLRRSASEMPRPLPPARDEVKDTLSVRNKLLGESLFYRILLWIRSVFTQTKREELYNRDLLSRIARSVSIQHPGVMDGDRRLLCTLFFERLKGLKDCADFFIPYMDGITERRGEFYVFMSSLVVPEVADAISSDADPYSLPLEQTISQDTKSSFLRRLNDALTDINDVAKQQMRASVACIEWIKQFAALRFSHFISQFALSGNNASCMFNYAKDDYAELAKVLSKAMTVSDKVLDALFLFSKKKGEQVIIDSNSEREMQEFVLKAATKLSAVQTFVSTVPVVSVGKVVWGNYDWNPDTFGGGEDWQQLFRKEWRDIFDEKWNAYLKDRKRKEIEVIVNEVYQIERFPALPCRPWLDIQEAHFGPEMTAAFIVWFAQKEWPVIAPAMKALMLEGVFVIPVNQNEYSVTVNELEAIMGRASEFAASLDIKGSVGSVLNTLAADRTNTINWQSKLTGVMAQLDSSVIEMRESVCKECRTAEKIFHGIFDNDVPSGYDTVRNLNAIKGAENKDFREKILRARKSLDGARMVLSEIEPLETPAKAQEGKLSSK